MSRSTSFIGLTRDAAEWVKQLIEMPNDHHTRGMFDEVVPLRTWRDVDGKYYYEVVQADPWASGPLIFTCIKPQEGTKTIPEEVYARDFTGNEWFSWVINPTLMGAARIDYERGHFCI